ncbi:conserved hypothetical protein [Culex quinquefasciatus]|uniref:MD-2-related lipid-recognition domain-containing protein n=1 Tax=Culex quinquefasciatus TaxID=7176 RepID=B0W4T8_CULQU|nr:conserved hypothetical protein [Culex quinquefasciatus]|eukprot:XP_001843722.1 conserved hypothetical protein [Culex quinquefasciatus]
MILWLAYLLLFSSCKAKIFFDIDEEFRDCENGKPLPQFDTSDFHIIVQDDGTIRVNGTWRLTSQRLQQGEWQTGIVSRDVPNICLNLQIPAEPWYPFTSLMKQKTCPYKAVHEEHADNINIGNYATIFAVPPEYLGDWRIYFTITTLRRGTFFEECIMSPVSVLEL